MSCGVRPTHFLPGGAILFRVWEIAPKHWLDLECSLVVLCHLDGRYNITLLVPTNIGLRVSWGGKVSFVITLLPSKGLQRGHY